MLIILTFLAAPAPAQAEDASGPRPLVLGEGPVESALAGHLAALRDPAGALTIGDVAFGEARERFARLPGNLTFGYTRDTVWLKLRLERGGARWPEPVYLVLKPTYIDEVVAYVPVIARPGDPSGYRRIRMGDHVTPPPGEELVIPDHVAALELPEAQALDIYLRIRTTSTMALRGQILTMAPLLRDVQMRTIKLTSLTTVMLTFAFIHLVYWISLRRPLFLSFCVYLLASAFTVITDGALLPPPVFIAGRSSDDFLTGIGVILPVIAAFIFTRYQLETRRYFPAADRLIGLLIPVLSLCLLAPFTDHYQLVVQPVLLSAVLIFSFLFAGNLQLFVQRRRPGSLLAAVASGQHLAGGVLVVGRLTGLLQFDALTEVAYQATSVVFVALMSLSLVQRARLADQRRRQGASLRIARKAEHAARRLVRIRTAELEEAKLAAESALAAERAAQAEQVRFVDVVTHQYQTPLAVIRSSAAAIQHTLPPSDTDNRRRVGQIQAAIRSLVEVLDVSLQRSRVEGVTTKAERVRVPAGATIADIVRRCRDLAPQREIALDMSTLPHELKIPLDIDMITIALTNLIDNAVKFSPAAPPIRVEAGVDGDRLVIRVLDCGIGIPRAETDQLAQRYFRASNTGGIPGSGLGLNIVLSIARAHGGQFRLENRSGGGAVAILALPLGADA